MALIVADPGRIDRRSTLVRALSERLVAILALAAAGVTVRLVVDLVSGGPETGSPGQLLGVGALVRAHIVITFSFLYWELDGDGPEARARAAPELPDRAFPEHPNPRLDRPGRRPEVFDHLYLGFTNATAFSPTDVMPLTHRAKLVMALKAKASVAVLGLVVARAVNIVK